MIRTDALQNDLIEVQSKYCYEMSDWIQDKCYKDVRDGKRTFDQAFQHHTMVVTLGAILHVGSKEKEKQIYDKVENDEVEVDMDWLMTNG